LGDLVWNGTLAPNARLVLGPAGVVSGGGAMLGNSVPRLACFDVSNLPAGVRASPSASMLILTNTSGAALSTITVHWAVK
jgi:hypothetical protein